MNALHAGLLLLHPPEIFESLYKQDSRLMMRYMLHIFNLVAQIQSLIAPNEFVPFTDFE